MAIHLVGFPEEGAFVSVPVPLPALLLKAVDVLCKVVDPVVILVVNDKLTPEAVPNEYVGNDLFVSDCVPVKVTPSVIPNPAIVVGLLVIDDQVTLPVELITVRTF